MMSTASTTARSFTSSITFAKGFGERREIGTMRGEKLIPCCNVMTKWTMRDDESKDDKCEYIVTVNKGDGKVKDISVPKPELSEDDREILDKVFERFDITKKSDREWHVRHFIENRWRKAAEKMAKELAKKNGWEYWDGKL